MYKSGVAKKDEYALSLKLFSRQFHKTVFLPLNPDLKDSEDFYRMCMVTVTARYVRIHAKKRAGYNLIALEVPAPPAVVNRRF